MFTAKIYPTQDLNEGLIVRIDEITGLYTATNNGFGTVNPSIADVKKMRVLWSSYLTETLIVTGNSLCKAGVQYIVVGSGSNTVVVDTKTYVLGNTFILGIDAVPIIGGGLSLNTTGIIAMQTTFLPIDKFFTVIPSQMGVDSLVYPDSVYHGKAEYYTTSYNAGDSLAAGTYIVNGDPGNVISVSGIHYNPGEVFVLSGIGSFSNITGLSTVNLFVANTTINFPLTYWSYGYKTILEQKYSDRNCACNEQYGVALEKIQSRLSAIEYNYEDDLNNDDYGTQIMIAEIAQIGLTEIRC